MVSFVLKQLRYDKANTAITLLALSAAISVILVLQSFEKGQYIQLEQATLNRNADLIAVQANVTNFMATRSVIPQYVREQIEDIQGVESTHPITTLPIIYKQSKKQTPVYLIVYDTDGGPSMVIDGKVESRGRTIVIDETLAKLYQLKVSDQFVVSNFAFTVSGITNEAAFMTPFAFINYDGLIDFFLESEVASDLSSFPLLSFLLIKVKKQESYLQVQESIEQSIPPVDVYSPKVLASNDVKLGEGFYKPILGLLTTVGFILGSLLISLLMFSAVTRHQRDFAVMLALGFKTHSLLIFTISLSCVLLGVSFLGGLIIANFISVLIEAVRPIYYFAVFHPLVLLKVGGMVALFALFGALAPYLKLRKCDPVTALHNAT